MILGIDEAGRGPWAGPLAVGAVVLGEQAIEGLNDSKLLSKKRREELSAAIHEKAAAAAIGWATAEEIDNFGLGPCLALATRRAVEQISVPYHEIIVDGTINFLKDTAKGKYVTTLKKADQLIASVSAASIIAKVARDKYMTEQDEVYPGYGFSRHSGYGTAAHRAAIEALGVTPLHRLSFAPLKAYGARATASPGAGKPSPTAVGSRAEDEACRYLEKHGHKILERNWRTKFCEIDIVSSFQEAIYFTEVKYRKSNQQGGGMSAITSRKLQQMKFAADYYVVTHRLDEVDRLLAAMSLSGQPPTVEDYLVIK